MAKVLSYPYKAVFLSGFDPFVIGEGGVVEFKMGAGQPGMILVIVAFEGGVERRFMVSPVSVIFECAEPTEIDVPDPIPALPPPPPPPPLLIAHDSRIRR